MSLQSVVKSLFVVVSLLLAGQSAQAFEQKAFDKAAVEAAQAAGKPVLIHITAPWCPTCKAQHKVLDSLSKKPDLAAIEVFDVDFDTQADVMKSFKANSQSTLIAFSGATETGRLAGATKSEDIEALLKTTLKK